jgi:ATP-binding cassette subfamily F protein uup
MDEPTNDLDIETLDVLEEYLDAWSGALVVASHDRYFLDRVCSDIFSIEPDGSVRHHPGGWSAYRAETLVNERSQITSKKPQRSRPKQIRRKLTYKDQRELSTLTRAVPRLERRREELARALDEAVGDYEQTLELSVELGQVLEELDAAETRWLHLTEEAERLASTVE